MNRFSEPSLARVCFADFIRFPGLSSVSACLGGAVMLVMLAACDRGGLPGKPVAHVNGNAITAYQLSDELGRNADDSHAGNGRSEALHALIDRELLQTEALKDRIDRDPHVAAALENARAEILAQAYLQSRVAYANRPSQEEIKTYFNKHPEKFSNRKLFQIKEIVLAPESITNELKAAMDRAKTLDDMSAWLDGQEVAHSQGMRLQDSAELPGGMLTKMANMQVGQLFLMNNGTSASLMVITGILDSPLDLDAAAPRIERMLLTQRGRELGESALQRLRTSARIEYADGLESRLAAARKGATAGATAVAAEDIVKVPGEQRGAAQ